MNIKNLPEKIYIKDLLSSEINDSFRIYNELVHNNLLNALYHLDIEGSLLVYIKNKEE